MEENVEQISINVEKVNKIKSKFPDEDLLFDIAENFKVFGDSTRMKIIAALLEEELNVSEIAEITNSTPSAISHQLRVLKQANEGITTVPPLSSVSDTISRNTFALSCVPTCNLSPYVDSITK